jgi:F-box only protein C-terminal region
VEWRVRNACHLVAYYRYYRFLPGGTLLYRTSPEVAPPAALPWCMLTLSAAGVGTGLGLTWCRVHSTSPI